MIKKFRNLSGLDKLKVVLAIWLQIAGGTATFIMAFGFSDHIDAIVSAGISWMSAVLGAIVFVWSKALKGKSDIDIGNE